MLKIRLQRIGRKKKPFYKIVVADARSPRDGRYKEQIGTYSPLLKRDDERRVKIDSEKALYWLKCGAQPTDRVSKFLSGLQAQAAASA
jgi:small subunit ribosomal protein S16